MQTQIILDEEAGLPPTSQIEDPTATAVSPTEDGVAAPDAAVEDAEAEEDCGPSFFDEEATCADILARVAAMLPADRTTLLPTIGQDPDGAAALLEVKFASILDRYQENSYLLHPYLEALMHPLVDLLLRYLPPAEEWWQQSQTAEQGTADPSSSPPASATNATENPFVIHANELGQNFDMFDVDAPKNALHLVCRAIYVIVKVVREKACTSYFPNDTKHYEDVFYALRHWRADPMCQREWEVRYCLLLWLSNLVLVPFDLNLIDTTLAQPPSHTDSQESAPSPSSSLSDALLVTAVGFLADTSKCREGAALLTARLLTRPDSRRHRDNFFRYVERVLTSSTATAAPTPLVEALESATAGSHAAFLFPGVLLAVAKTMKLGKREELVVYASTSLITSVVALFHARASDALLCKTAIKVTQRLVLAMLRKTTANWRYQRHVASLSHNLAAQNPQPGTGTNTTTTPQPGNEEAAEVEEGAVIEGDEEALEEGIGVLLEAIGHKDTIVRWSAAKGIGRVCARLPVAMAEEVIEALMADAFASAYNDSQWHGGLLALAELCRRSMISAEQLPQVVSTIARGLAFDLSKGTYSVGSHVRDAACYTCWSIARAYDAADLEAHVQRLSVSLVVTALFDREVNVRRAAAAAFQECVGRLGNFPDGIDLVTTMDFFSLASLKNAYEVVAPRVAVYDAYRPSMLTALMETKLLHWDRRVRQEAAAALGAVAPFEPVLTIKQSVLPTLLKRVVDEAVGARHGAILGLAALVASLPVDVWTEEDRQQLAEVLTRVDAARLFRARGGEFVRAAMCGLLRAFATVHLTLPETVTVTKVSGATAKAKTLGRCQEFLEETWKNLLEWLQLVAAETFRVFAGAYYTTFSAPFHVKMMGKLLSGCVAGTSPLERRGFLAALGGLPEPLLSAPVPPTATAETDGKDGADRTEETVLYAELVLKALCAGSLVQPDEDPELADAESRRNAVSSLGSVLLRVPLSSSAITPASYNHVLETLLSALQDYAVDKRGDVGSLVRVSVLQVLPSVLLYGCQSTVPGLVPVLTPDAGLRAVQGIVKAALEKLDRVRRAAGLALCALLVSPGSDRFVAGLTQHAAEGVVPLQRFLAQQAASLEWSSPSQVMPLIVPLVLTMPCADVFGLAAMEGLVLSTGDVSGHVHGPAEQALLAVARDDGGRGDQDDGETSEARQVRLSRYIVTVAQRYVHCERVLVPLSRTADACLSQSVLHESCHAELVEMLRGELRHYALNITVLLPLVTLLASLCRSANDSARVSAWTLTLTMVASRYPKVRQKVATEFYTSLLVLSSSSTVSGAIERDGGEGCPSSDGIQRAMAHLLETQWDGTDATKIRTARDALYGMLCLTAPSAKAKAAHNEVGMATSKTTSGANASSYMSLVREAGY